MSRHLHHAAQLLLATRLVPLRFPTQERTTIALLVSVLVTSVGFSIALFALAGCGASEQRPPTPSAAHVASVSPIGTASFSNQTIRIQFDRPVVPLASVGRIDGALPAIVEPAVPLTGRFLDRKTLVLTPVGNMARSTRYRVTLARSLKDIGFGFDFVSVPLQVDGMWGVDPSSVGRQPKLPIHFNQPIESVAVEAGCAFSNPATESTIPVSASATSAEGGTAIITVAPRQRLAPDSKYLLRCAGLSGIEGNDPMHGSFVLELRTRSAM